MKKLTFAAGLTLVWAVATFWAQLSMPYALLLGLVLLAGAMGILAKFSLADNDQGNYSSRSREERDVQLKTARKAERVYFTVGGLALLMVICWVVAATLSVDLRTKVIPYKGAKVVGIPQLDQANLPLVSKDMALKAMSQQLGQLQSLASQFELGDLTKQLVKGDLTWVAPLEPRSLFKALFAGAAPGYFTVSASGSPKASYVEYAIELNVGQWFNPTFRTWLNNPVYAASGSPSFELDDNGKAHWVVRQYGRKSLGLSAKYTVNIVVFDVQTGSQTVYPSAQAPAWVDTVTLSPTVLNAIDDAGELVNGWFNPSDEGKFRISSEMDTVQFNGQIWYSGTISGLKSAQSINEMVLVNSRSLELRRFTVTGVSETEAGKAMSLPFKATQLKAANPLLYTVSGEIAWVSAMVDYAEVVQGYAVVAVNDMQTIGTGASLAEAINAFSTRSGRSAAALGSVKEETIQGVVTMIRQDSASGQVFLLVVVNGEKLLVNAAPHLSEELHVTQTGDQVVIAVKKNGNRAIALSFDNKGI